MILGWSWVPNGLTIVRIMLVIPWVVCVYHEQYSWALVILLVAGFSDALDGWLARRYLWQSRVGSILDPLADKVLANCVFWVFADLEIIPVALAVLLSIRDIVVVSGAWVCWRKLGAYTMKPSPWGKGTMIAIVAMTWWYSVQWVWSIPDHGTGVGLMVLVAILLVMSAMNYVMRGVRVYSQGQALAKNY